MRHPPDLALAITDILICRPRGLGILQKIGILLAALILSAAGCSLSRAAAATDHYFLSSDGARLHYLEAGTGPETIVFIPGWTMPAWIWTSQLDALSTRFRTIALDPRGQGDSEITRSGYTADRRGRDIGDLLARLGPAPVVLVGWSLGVLDVLAYVGAAGESHVAGLVLVDNSIGAGTPPRPRRRSLPGTGISRQAGMSRFVRSLFRTRQSPAFLDRLTRDALRTPPQASRALLNYAEPRTFWRDTIYATTPPVLYVTRPGLENQATILLQRRPATEYAMFSHAGHALFVDEPALFNRLVVDFIRRRIWAS